MDNFTSFEKQQTINQILQFEGKKVFDALNSIHYSISKKKAKKIILEFWDNRKKQVISAIEEDLPIPKLKIPPFDENALFLNNSKLNGRAKVARRNAKKNKLIKKYGIFAHKHKSEFK